MFIKGFDNDKYLKLQSQKMKERIELFGEKLYLEFGGKLFDDFHASRVLPGFAPDSKIKMLIDAIFFKILFGRDELVCYKIDSIEDFGYISDFAAMLETYSFLYGKREAFMETMEYIKEIDKMKDKSIFYQK